MIIISLSEIFSDALKYPFGDYKKFLIVGVLALLAGLSTIVGNFNIDSTAVSLLAGLIGLIFTLILSGYSVDVIKRGIEHSDEIPDVDFMTNLVNGIKVLVIEIVYFLIPIIITVILAMITGAIGVGLDHLAAALGVTAIIAVIIFIVFAIFETVAVARFADTGDMGEALNIGEVIEDVKRIGVLKIVAFVILALFTVVIAFAIAGLLGIIPYVGIIIGTILAGGFVALFYNKALGMLYSLA